MSVFRECINDWHLADHLVAFRSYMTRIGWLVAEEAGEAGETTVHCRLPERGDAAPMLKFEKFNRTTHFAMTVGREDLPVF